MPTTCAPRGGCSAAPRSGTGSTGASGTTRDESDQINGAWLQYWVFYYYNSFHEGPFGKHEADWEMIQIQVDANATPRRAAYAQHDTGSLCNCRGR